MLDPIAFYNVPLENQNAKTHGEVYVIHTLVYELSKREIVEILTGMLHQCKTEALRVNTHAGMQSISFHISSGGIQMARRPAGLIVTVLASAVFPVNNSSGLEENI